MKRLIIVTILILISYLLEVSVFSYFKMAGIVPNIMLILVVSFAVMRGNMEGMLIGFFSGLILDGFSGEIIGYYALIFLVIGYLNGFFQPLIYSNNMMLPLILVLVSSLVYNFIIYFFSFMFRNKLDIEFYTMHVMIPETVYTFFIAIFLYNFYYYINHKLEVIEKRSSI
ncbi:MAG: rod shape-determining protein MreD [Lachnospiraceae bacterium]|nr:rod shape-determining protein MreD [Lachnospiraceae bacterium]